MFMIHVCMPVAQMSLKLVLGMVGLIPGAMILTFYVLKVLRFCLSCSDCYDLFGPILSEQFLKSLLIQDSFKTSNTVEADGSVNFNQIVSILSDDDVDHDAPLSLSSPSAADVSLCDIFDAVGITLADVERLVLEGHIDDDSIAILENGPVGAGITPLPVSISPIGGGDDDHRHGYSLDHSSIFSEYGPVGGSQSFSSLYSLCEHYCFGERPRWGGSLRSS